jgi:hypothetical protein
MAEKSGKPGRGGRPGRRWSPVRLARRHPFISVAAAVIGAGLVIFVLVWFQPQKLFLNKTVNEPVPGVIQTVPARGNKPHRHGWPIRAAGPAGPAVGQFPQS